MAVVVLVHGDPQSIGLRRRVVSVEVGDGDPTATRTSALLASSSTFPSSAAPLMTASALALVSRKSSLRFSACSP